MADNVRLPGGMGGLIRYDEEYKSRFMITPTQVIIFVALILLLIILLNVFHPIV